MTQVLRKKNKISKKRKIDIFKNNLLNTSNIEKIIKKYKVNVIIHLLLRLLKHH